MSKNGFTLAELLITISIIGVTFILTLSTVLTSVGKNDVPPKLKKVGTTFAQVVNALVAENGQISSWNWTSADDPEAGEEMMEKLFKPKLNIAKYCGLQTGKGCGNEYFDINGNPVDNWDDNPDVSKALLGDGTSFSFEMSSNCVPSATIKECATFMVDLNGPKKPNRVGRDIFYFALYTNGVFTSLGAYETAEDVNLNCSSGGDGVYCAAKIVNDSWQILSDGPNPYPW